jgi:hypothetical protein
VRILVLKRFFKINDFVDGKLIKSTFSWLIVLEIQYKNIENWLIRCKVKTEDQKCTNKMFNKKELFPQQKVPSVVKKWTN